MNKKNNIGNDIKSRLANSTAIPDDSVWLNIEKELKKKRHKRLLIFWWLSIGSLFIISLLILFVFNNESILIDKSNHNNPITKSIDNNTKNTSISNNKEDTVNTLKKQDTINNIYSINKISSLNSSLEQKENNHNSNSSNSSYSDNSPNNPSFNNSSKTNKADKAKEYYFQSSTDKKNNTSSLLDKSKKTNQNINTKITEDEISKESMLKKPSTETNDINKKEDKELKERLKDSLKNSDFSRWSINPQGILSFYGAFGESTKNNSNYNYGFLASYRVNTKLYIRTGFKQIKLKQDIDDINREVTYYQFPLEVKYSPFSNKINPYIIGGFSYFNYVESKTNSITDNFNTTIGINSGLGLESKLWKKTYINIEGTFDYQLMPFSSQNSTKPYILNLSLGIEYRF